MDCRTGEIYQSGEMQKLAEAFEKENRQAELKHFVPLTQELANELEPLGKRQRKNSMRNKCCPCGSNKKFKRCCWSKFS